MNRSLVVCCSEFFLAFVATAPLLVRGVSWCFWSLSTLHAKRQTPNAKQLLVLSWVGLLIRWLSLWRDFVTRSWCGRSGSAGVHSETAAFPYSCDKTTHTHHKQKVCSCVPVHLRCAASKPHASKYIMLEFRKEGLS
jgi:hypothetical protein